MFNFPFIKKDNTAPVNTQTDLLTELVSLVLSRRNDARIVQLLSSKKKSNNPAAIPYTPEAITKDLQIIRMYISIYNPSSDETANLVAVRMFHKTLKSISDIVSESGYTPLPIEKLISMNTFCSAQQTIMELKEIKVTKYKISSCVDSRTCDKCKKMNGKIFSVAKAVSEKNLPPFCDSCRCVIVPEFDFLKRR